jgi:hypothetical protein
MIKNFLTNALWVVLIGSVLMFPMIIAWISGFDFVRGLNLAILVIANITWAATWLVVANS